MHAAEASEPFLSAWRQRLKALRNIPPALKIVWQAGPQVVASGVAFRLVAALIPLAVLAVSRRIIDAIVAVIKTHSHIATFFWWLVALEFALALAGTVMARLCDYCDGLLADRFTRHVSVRVMEHASRLDLSSYEDPEFYDKLERARRAGHRPDWNDPVHRAIVAAESLRRFQPFGQHSCFLSVAAAASDCRRDSCLPRRKSFRVPRDMP